MKTRIPNLDTYITECNNMNEGKEEYEIGTRFRVTRSGFLYGDASYPAGTELEIGPPAPGHPGHYSLIQPYSKYTLKIPYAVLDKLLKSERLEII